MIKKISVYKTVQEKLPKAFCMLAEKCYHNGISVFVYTNSNEYAIELDRVLWSYSKKQFIPHATIHDLFPEKQPILIGSEFKNLNNASGVIIVNLSESEILSILSNRNLLASQYERLFFIYDDSVSLSGKSIKNIIIKSSIVDGKFESYVQSDNNSWQAENINNN